MKQQISRDGFPRTGDYLSFVKFFVSLEEPKRSNVFISPVHGSPGSFNFCVFPGTVTLPPESETLLRPARLVAELMDTGTAGGWGDVSEGTALSVPKPGIRPAKGSSFE